MAVFTITAEQAEKGMLGVLQELRACRARLKRFAELGIANEYEAKIWLESTLMGEALSRIWIAAGLPDPDAADIGSDRQPDSECVVN